MADKLCSVLLLAKKKINDSETPVFWAAIDLLMVSGHHQSVIRVLTLIATAKKPRLSSLSCRVIASSTLVLNVIDDVPGTTLICDHFCANTSVTVHLSPWLRGVERLNGGIAVDRLLLCFAVTSSSGFAFIGSDDGKSVLDLRKLFTQLNHSIAHCYVVIR